MSFGGDALTLAVRDESELGQALAGLRRAQAAFDAGQPLIAGHLADELPEAQLIWIRERRPELLAGFSTS